MFVLVACEESQEVCKAFRSRGHEAFSCDIQECSGGHPEWHIKGDVLPLLNGRCSFITEGDVFVTIPDKWDLIIAHPPCTYMSIASACRMYHKRDGFSYLDEYRVSSMIISRDLFMSMYYADCEHIAIENPMPLRIACLPKCSQIIQPYEYGHPYTKKTCLWLKGLPVLLPTNIVDPIKGSWVNGNVMAYIHKGKDNIFGKTSSKERAKTFHGIAEAMAEQWSIYLKETKGV